MNKSVLIWILIIFFVIFSVYIDYRGYDLAEADLDSTVYDVLSEITYPDDADYIIEDYYEEERFLVYSGQVYINF